jgi:hypothetical protein
MLVVLLRGLDGFQQLLALQELRVAPAKAYERVVRA